MEFCFCYLNFIEEKFTHNMADVQNATLVWSKASGKNNDTIHGELLSPLRSQIRRPQESRLSPDEPCRIVLFYKHKVDCWVLGRRRLIFKEKSFSSKMDLWIIL